MLPLRTQFASAFLLLTLAGCSKPTPEEQKKQEQAIAAAFASAMTTPSSAPVGTPALTGATVDTKSTGGGAVPTSPQMTAFMAMLDGGDTSASKALKKFGGKAVQGDDLGMYSLKDPKVTKSETVGALQCYTMESSAGVMTHITQLCWDAKGKIAKISDTSS
jgi:hypothetical protein